MATLRVKKVTSMEKVFPAQEPTGEGMADCLTALKGETVSWQLAYYWEDTTSACAHVKLCSPIRDRVRVRSVRLVPCQRPNYAAEAGESYLFSEPTLAPDLLTEIPSYGMDLIGGQWRSLWIDVETAADMEAGSYPVQIQIVKEEEILGTAKIQLELLNAELPQLPIPHTEWFHTDCLADYYGVEVFDEEYWRITENFVRTAVKRHCNMLLTPVFTPPLDTEIGAERRTVQLVEVEVTEAGYRFDYSNFERWVEMCKRCGIQYYEISHLFTQWGAACAPKVVGTVNGEKKQLFGWDTDAAGKAYQNFLHQFLISLKGELERLGISGATYFHVSDEPGEKDIKAYRAARRVMAENLEGYQMIDALSNYRYYEEGLVSQPVCALNHIRPFLENRPEKLWGYYCVSQWETSPNRFIAHPGSRTRILGTLLYRYELDGFLHWGYNFYNRACSMDRIDPYRTTDGDGTLPSGDPFVVYPGKDGAPEESLRLMLMDEAMSDLCAMNLLEELAGRDAVLKCLGTEAGEALTFDEYPTGNSYLTSVREKVNRRIEELVR